MYRVIFESVDPRVRCRVVERGPWLVDLRAAKHWKSFFDPRLPHQKIWIESADALGVNMPEAMP